jgi:hypothetical protein
VSDEHVPTPDYPWVRVRDQFGNELDRAYYDDGIKNGTFEVIEGYPPNQTRTARETKIRTDKGPKPAIQVKGAELAERLEAAGLTEATAGMTADEKRAALAEYEATHVPDPALEG